MAARRRRAAAPAQHVHRAGCAQRRGLLSPAQPSPAQPRSVQAPDAAPQRSPLKLLAADLHPSPAWARWLCGLPAASSPWLRQTASSGPMLRGQASLQALLGKEQSYKRKKPAKPGQPSKRARPDAAASRAPEPAAAGSRQGAGQHAETGCADGLCECPVCQRRLRAEDIDAHLGARLQRAALHALHARPHGRRTDPAWRAGTSQSEARACSADDCLPAAEARRHSGRPVTRTVRRLDSRQRSKPVASSPHQPSAGQEDRGSPQGAAQRPLAASGKVTSPFKARAGPQGGAAPADGPEDAQLVTVSTVIVGRRFRSTEAVSVGMAVDLQHDDVNARDENAVMVLAGDSWGLLGYIPREVAAVLCPLLKQAAISLTGQVQRVGRTAAAPVPIHLQARYSPDRAGGRQQPGAPHAARQAAPARGPGLA